MIVSPATVILPPVLKSPESAVALCTVSTWDFDLKYIVMTHESITPSRLKGTTAANMKQGKSRKKERKVTIMMTVELLAATCTAE